MGKIKVTHKNNFTVIDNYHFRDGSLSLAAIGLMDKMLSLPEDWDYSVSGLADICKEGRDTIARYLKELEKHGYLVREQIRNENGKFSDIDYVLLEVPHTGKPCTENPYTVIPNMEKPNTENPAQLNTKELNTKELSTKEDNLLPYDEKKKLEEDDDGEFTAAEIREIYNQSHFQNLNLTFNQKQMKVFIDISITMIKGYEKMDHDSKIRKIILVLEQIYFFVLGRNIKSKSPFAYMKKIALDNSFRERILSNSTINPNEENQICFGLMEDESNNAVDYSPYEMLMVVAEQHKRENQTAIDYLIQQARHQRVICGYDVSLVLEENNIVWKEDVADVNSQK